jgi:hypothetical protein
MTIGQEGRPERVTGFELTPSLFRILKAQPYRGRLLNESDGVEGQDRQLVISHALWQGFSAGATMRLARSCASRAVSTPSSVCCRASSCS